MLIFGKGNKVRILVESLHEGWGPWVTAFVMHRNEKLKMTKCGWVLEFQERDLIIKRPERGKLVKAWVGRYHEVRLTVPYPWHLRLNWQSPVVRLFDLRNPELGVRQASPTMPNFEYLRQFVGPIHRLMHILGRPPCLEELVKDIRGILPGISDKRVKQVFKDGEGYFWTSRIEKNTQGTEQWRMRRYFYIIPNVTLPDAAKIWRDQLKGSWEVEKYGGNKS